MFSKLISVINIDLELQPETGLLVSSGSEPIDPTLPDISFARTVINCVEVPFIPGSSIKGPVRAFCESVLRSFASGNNANKYACDITDEKSCCSKESRDKEGKEKYKETCLACRTFGGTSISSVVRFSDFYPFENPLNITQEQLRRINNLMITRTGIKINRATGKVESTGPFEYESAFFPFYGRITLKNPEKWQVGLIFFALDQINEGLIKFGRSKSRGLGWVKANLKKVEVFSPNKKMVFRKNMDGIEETNLFSFSKPLIVLSPEQIDQLKQFCQKDFEGQLRGAVNYV